MKIDFKILGQDCEIEESQLSDLKQSIDELKSGKGELVDDHDLSKNDIVTVLNSNKTRDKLEIDDFAHLAQNRRRWASFDHFKTLLEDALQIDSAKINTDNNIYNVIDENQEISGSNGVRQNLFYKPLASDKDFIWVMAQRSPEKLANLVNMLPEWKEKYELMELFFSQVSLAESFECPDEDCLSEEFIFLLALTNPPSLEKLPPEVFSTELVDELIQSSDKALYPYFPEMIRNDFDIALAELIKNDSVWTAIPEAIRTDEKFLNNFLKANPLSYLKCVSPEIIEKNIKFILETYQKTYPNLFLPLEFKIPDPNLSREDAKILIEICPAVLEKMDTFINDKELVMMALSKAPFLYMCLSSELKKDFDIIRQACKTNDQSIASFVPYNLTLDPDVTTELISYNGHFLLKATVDPKIRGDINMIISALQATPEIFGLLTEEEKNNPVLQKVAIESDPNLFFKMIRTMVDHMEDDVMLFAVSLLPKNFNFLPKEKREDYEFVSKCVSINGFVLEFITNEFKQDEKIIVSAMKSSPQMYWSLTEEQRKILEFYEKNHGHLMNRAEIPVVYSMMSLSTVMTSDLLRLIFKKENITLEFSEEQIQKYVDDFNNMTVARERIGSFSKMVHVFLTNHRDDFGIQDDRPVVVVLQSSDDWNNAFIHNSVINDFIESGIYRVAYYEVSNERQILNALKSYEESHLGKKIDVLCVSGHGYSRGVILDYTLVGLPNRMDVKDAKWGLYQKLADSIAPQGHFILNSCSTASGGEENNNLANAIRRYLPRDILLHAPRTDARIGEIDIFNDGSFRIQRVPQMGYTRYGLSER